MRRGRPAHPDILTPAEWRVVQGIRHGLSNPAIARRQGISLDAVKYHVTNVLQKLGMQSRREIRHWGGVHKDSLLLARRAADVNQPTSIGPLGQIARSVRDIRVAESFFRDTLGLPHLYTFGELAFFDCGGTRLLLSQQAAPAPESILYFQTQDIHGTATQLAAKGVEFIGAPHLVHRHADGTEEWMAFFNDPEGRPLGLIAQIPPSQQAVP